MSLSKARRFLSSAFIATAWCVLAAPAPPSLYPDRDIAAGLGPIGTLAFSSDGRLLAAAGAQGFGVWDAQTGNLIKQGGAGPAAPSHVAFGGQGTLLALGGADGRVSVLDLRLASTREVAKHSKPVRSLAFAADGRLGASGDSDGNIFLWDADRGVLGPLVDGGHKKDIVILSFGANNVLASASKDLQAVSWDTSGKRPLRRGTLQSGTKGRAIVLNGAGAEPEGTTVIFAGQLVTEPRGGMFTDQRGPARPGDLPRSNVLLPYASGTGISSAPIATADFEAERVAVSPSACFAFFTSNYRNQARLHVWGLIERGDNLLQTELPAHATAIALEPGGRLVAIATETGHVMTWRVSGAAASDCDDFKKSKGPAPSSAEPKITLGPETEPLIDPKDGDKIAVLPFATTGVDSGLGDGVAEMVTGELSNRPGLVVAERREINAILRELDIQSSGLTDLDAIRAGRGVNARKVLFGSVRRFGEDTFIVQVRIVDVATQRIQGSREASCEHCKEGDLPRTVAALRRIIVR